MRWGPNRKPSEQPAHGAAEKPTGESPWSTARFLLVLIVLAWAVRSLVVAPFSIPSGSMLPTLYVGDYLMVAKWPYGYSRVSFPLGLPAFDGRILGDLPKRGDVAVFRHPSGDIDLIKRIIGLPGDVVEVKNGRPIVNGRPLQRGDPVPVRIPVSANSPCKSLAAGSAQRAARDGRPYCSHRAFRETLPGGVSYFVLDQVDNGAGDEMAAMRVPPGHVFMMGDNRDDSLDSRFPPAIGGVGMVPVDRLIGRALVTFWSTDGSASWFKPWTWFSALRPSRIGNGYSGAAE